MNKIPKCIHYCWFGGNPMPELMIQCIDSWKKMCHDYEIKRWDESNFDINQNKYIREAYKCKKWAFVTDLVRLMIIYEYGGIYLDVDVELIKPLDELVENFDAFMGFETAECVATGLGFGAAKNNKIIYEMIQDYDNISFILDDGSYDLKPCPQRNTIVLRNHGLKQNNTLQKIGDVTILPTEYLCPKNYKTGELKITKNTYSIHHYTASWFRKGQRGLGRRGKLYKKFIGRHLGEYIYKIDRNICLYGLHRTLKKMFFKLKKEGVKNLVSKAETR